ncbi:XAC2610-related protein [Chryseobacterium sp. NFX27]|uniref:XAC2610-related protein n=1 Tax=Chryseobacterium sp. NFX27 TaxID=2819618 RepID=UPI003CF46DD8
MINTSLFYRSLYTLLLLGPVCFGQYRFAIEDASKKYNAEVTVEECQTDACRNKAAIILFSKSGEKLQTLASGDFIMYFKEGIKPSNTGIVTLTHEMVHDDPLVFGDFNFDGTEDVGIRNGSGGNYGSASFDVYVFNSTKKQFVLSKELTEIASSYQGMFDVDPKRKRLTTYARSGASLHYTYEYQVIPNKGLDLVYEKIGDFSEEPPKVTIREKINNKWVVKKSTEY